MSGSAPPTSESVHLQLQAPGPELGAPSSARAPPPARAQSSARATAASEILIVEDDVPLRSEVAAYLRDNCFSVREAGDAAAMDRSLGERPAALVILDIGLPGEGGLSICRRLTAHGQGPAVILATAAGAETDRVVGLEVGADDYLSKPYGPRELLARVKAVLRRAPARPQSCEAAGFVFELDQRCMTTRAGVIIQLTETESAILDALLRNAGRVVARDEFGLPPRDAASRAIDLQVSRLRRKLAAHGAPDLIRTHRGLGYLLDGRVAPS